MKKLLTPILLVLLLLVPLADAQTWCGTTQHPGDVPLYRNRTTFFQSGNSLYTLCTTQSMDGCVGYITGVADVLAAQPANRICVPDNAIARQVVDVVKKYLADHPESRHYAAASEITIALLQAFPCNPNQ